jgi:catechol 2,3-dioxygenase-like lactoylglutathione lyase family enzyme
MITVKEVGLATIDMKLEVIVIPVSDAERAEQFYRKLGWRQDVTPRGSGVFQFTPRGRVSHLEPVVLTAVGGVQR